MRGYRYAEKCLYSYEENVKELDRLEGRIAELKASSDVRGLDYSAGATVNDTHSDPVSGYVEELDRLERRYRKCVHRVDAVKRLRADLLRESRRDEQHRLILEEYYLARRPVTRILESTGWSRGSFFARRYDLVMRTLSYLLEVDSLTIGIDSPER